MRTSCNLRKNCVGFFIICLSISSLFSQGCQVERMENSGDFTVAPNIVVVLIDDLRWDEFGVAGHSQVFHFGPH